MNFLQISFCPSTIPSSIFSSIHFMNSRWRIFGSIIPSVRLTVFSPALTPHITTVSIPSKILPHSELSTTRTHNLRMNKILAISSCKNAEVVLNFYTVNMKNLRDHASYSFYLAQQQKGDGHFITNRFCSKMKAYHEKIWVIIQPTQLILFPFTLLRKQTRSFPIRLILSPKLQEIGI